MPEYTTKELLELASCPPGEAVTSQIAPIDVVEERLLLQREALDGPILYVVNLCCEEMVGIGTALTKIERHLKRLVNKELKGTGVSLAQIANYLKVIAGSTIGENNVLLQQLFQQQLFATPVPADRPPSEEPPAVAPFAQAPETVPSVEALVPGEGPFGEIPETILPPQEEIIPSFVPEVSTAVGGETFAAPVPRGPVEEEAAPQSFGPVPNQPVELILPPATG